MLQDLPYQNRSESRAETKSNWYRRWFGPTREDVWRALAHELDATFVTGGWRTGEKVVIRTGPAGPGDDLFELTLDLYMVPAGKTSVPYTRFRTPYVNPSGFRFAATRAGLFSPLAQLLGAQDITVGDEEFDKAYVIKSNQPDRAPAFFKESKVRAGLMGERHTTLSVDDHDGYFGAHFPPGTDQLTCMTPGDIRDLDHLHRLFTLCADTLAALHACGAAGRSDPAVKY